MTPAQIAALPASWYASQPVPPRLADALTRRVRKRRGAFDSELRRLFRLVHPYTTLTPVERCHRRHLRELAAEGWVCPKCGRVWSPMTDRCKACQP